MTSRKEEDGHHHLRLKVPGSLVFLTFLASCLLHCKNLPLDREDSERKRRERGEKEAIEEIEKGRKGAGRGKVINVLNSDELADSTTAPNVRSWFFSKPRTFHRRHR
jgi:hypothetical protein